MTTLNAAFKKTFEPLLTSKGYMKVKGRQPYFARMVGKELVQVITTRSRGCGENGTKVFEILGGMASVYQKTVDLTLSPNDNGVWLYVLSHYYYAMNWDNFDREYRRAIMEFSYVKDDEESLYQAMRQALKETEKNILGVFDNIHNLRDYMDFLYKINFPRLGIKYYEERGVFEGNSANEGYLYFVIDDHSDLKEPFENDLAKKISSLEFESVSEKMNFIA